MSKQSIQALLERVESDDEFRTHTLMLPLERRKEFIRQAGYDIEPSDVAYIHEIAGAPELSDEDLERVAGGGSVTSVAVRGGVGGTVAVAGIVAIAAAFAF